MCNGILAVIERRRIDVSPYKAIKIHTRDCTFCTFAAHLVVKTFEEVFKWLDETFELRNGRYEPLHGTRKLL